MSTQTLKRSEAGFTLVELAIVMVIIGLLIGGVLKGQELITNAKVSATITQLKGVDAAMNTFQDKFNALAGDMASANTRLPNGVAAESGDGNGSFNVTSTTATAGVNPVSAFATGAAGEGSKAFTHLARADLINGIDVNNAVTDTFGGRLPTIPLGGGMWLGATNDAGGATGLAGLQGNRMYASLTQTPDTFAAANSAINVDSAAQVDRKIDDGNPGQGTARSLCTTGGAGANYNEAVQATCAMYVRVMN